MEPTYANRKMLSDAHMQHLRIELTEKGEADPFPDMGPLPPVGKRLRSAHGTVSDVAELTMAWDTSNVVAVVLNGVRFVREAP